MSAKILDGKKLSGEIAEKLKLKVSKLKVKPSLAIIQVGDLPQSSSYIERKKNYGANIGATVHHIMLPEKVSEKKILELITELNLRKDIHGIIVQTPLPKQIDFSKILRTAKETQTYLEINASPQRLDLKDLYIRQAKEAGVKMIINTDSHHKSQLEYMKYGVTQARRGWAEREDILNTNSAEKLLSFFEVKS